MNPWRQHPALVGLPIPEAYLPPAPVVTNPRMSTAWSPSQGPVPPLSPDDPLGESPSDAVYAWLLEQATARLKGIKKHVRTGKPPVAVLARQFGARPEVVKSWVAAARQAGVGRIEIPKPRPFKPGEVSIPKGVTYFASGAQESPGDIEGLARLAKKYGGFGVGVEVSKCVTKGGECRLALDHVAGRGVPLFVDSGAYPEFKCIQRGQDQCVISDADWRRRLEAYEWLSRRFKSKAYLVAPDMIGSQAGTERRLKAHGHLLAKAGKQNGSWILLVAHSGREPQAKFWLRMREVLVKQGVPRDKVVAAVPMREAVTTVPQLAKLAGALGKKVKRWHLLGLGPSSRGSSPHTQSRGAPTTKLGAAVAAIRASNKSASITCDSVFVKRGVGYGDKRFFYVHPKVLSYAQDIVRYELMHDAFQRSWQGGEALENWIPAHGWGEDEVPEYHEHIRFVDDWLPPKHRREFAAFLADDPWSPAPTRKQAALLLESPEEFLMTEVHPGDRGGVKWYEIDSVAAWLDHQWAQFLGAYFTARVRRDAMVMAWRRGDTAAMIESFPSLKDAPDNLVTSYLAEIVAFPAPPASAGAEIVAFPKERHQWLS